MMSALRLSDIAIETGGELLGDALVSGVSTDSRCVSAGDLFVALVGENFDGNGFVQKAVAGGAVAAIVTDATEIDIPRIRVEDSRLALGLVARMNRRQFSGPLVALTGSAGKTTCKEMIASILRQCGEVLATRANYNNEIGTPLTLLGLEPKHEYAVIEMGASRANDIRYLAQFAEPTIALVTNAMAAHIEGFGSLQEVARTKGQILESVADNGVAIINIDDTFSEQWKQQAGAAAIVTVSLANADADFYARSVTLGAGGTTQFTLCTPEGEVEIHLSLLGIHNTFNAIAAAAAAYSAGASLEAIQAGLGAMVPVKGRLQVVELNSGIVIDDTYNANPGAVRAAIDLLAEYPGERCLVLGAMAELGTAAQAEHDAIARYARDRKIDRLVMVGPFAQQATKDFGQAFSDVETMLAAYGDGMSADVILVKGSRSAKMERVVEALIENKNKRGDH